jgi:hypothetical protein
MDRLRLLLLWEAEGVSGRARVRRRRVVRGLWVDADAIAWAWEVSDERREEKRKRNGRIRPTCQRRGRFQTKRFEPKLRGQ